MKILLNNRDLNKALKNVTDIGFVPTMGGIHDGHISLIKKSKKECKKTIVSIFVNPTQFNNKKDFNDYPKNKMKDLSILKKNNINYVFIPKINHIYKKYVKSKIKIVSKDKILCARFRRGHFEGVLDVVEKFTKIIKPNKIFMGEKDYQQLYLVKKFIEKKYSTKIISCKTIRNKNKLAMSTRNFLLNKTEINIAEKVAKNLFRFKKLIKNKKNLNNLLIIKKKELIKLYKIKIEYLDLRKEKNLLISNTISKSRLFIAYYLNKIRLIDNF
jgi:pantoate--beta-alanine ligase